VRETREATAEDRSGLLLIALFDDRCLVVAIVLASWYAMPSAD
jgi:hypothetical protein